MWRQHRRDVRGPAKDCPQRTINYFLSALCHFEWICDAVRGAFPTLNVGKAPLTASSTARKIASASVGACTSKLTALGIEAAKFSSQHRSLPGSARKALATPIDSP